jgi:hypothetical protein
MPPKRANQVADATTDRRPVIKWPEGLLEDARKAAGDEGLSAFVVSCALGVITDKEAAAVRQLADELHLLAVQQVELATRAQVLTRQGKADEAEQAKSDWRPFAKASIHVLPGDLEAVSNAAEAAGFLREDDPQPMGRPSMRDRVAQARSFTAFLRAAVAAELDPRNEGGARPTMQAATDELLAGMAP